jgi:hypothetical protein
VLLSDDDECVDYLEHVGSSPHCRPIPGQDLIPVRHTSLLRTVDPIAKSSEGAVFLQIRAQPTFEWVKNDVQKPTTNAKNPGDCPEVFANGGIDGMLA